MTERMFAATQFQPKEFVFNSENKVEAERIVAKYPIGRQASALLPLLDLAQRQHVGWLPKAAIRYVAGLLDVPEIRAFEVASFYTMFNLSPRGKFLVQLCRTTPCWLRGSDELQGVCARHLGIKVGETTSDGVFTLVEVECLGACVNAPMIQINDDYYEDLTPDKAEKIFKGFKEGILPKNGSQSGRNGSEPIEKRTTLLKNA